MSIGESGRVVIELEPGFKKELYAELRQEGKSLKSWFLENAEEYLFRKGQSRLKQVATPEVKENV